MENIIFWEGYTTHIFELSLAMARKGYNVKVIRNAPNEKRTERIPQAAYNNVDIIECNDNATALRICKEHDKEKTLHINGSIKVSDVPSHHALRYLLKSGYKVISLPQEGFQLQGIKGKLNYLKWLFYLNFTWRRNMNAWGITGLNALRQFSWCGMNREKLFQFIYVTRQTDNQLITPSHGGG